MMDYQKYYPAPSTYPPPTGPMPAHDPRFAASQPHTQPPAVAVVVPVPPPQLPAPPPGPPSSAASSSSYAHRPLRPSYDHFDQPQHEMPRSAPPPPAYNPRPPDGPPDLNLRNPDTGYASLRRGGNGYHVSQATNGSRKRSHRDQAGGIQGAVSRFESNSDQRYRGGLEHPPAHLESEYIF
ncbi:hypothetical protein BJX70DRAFT_360329 [Aspergillus crustosus]